MKSLAQPITVPRLVGGEQSKESTCFKRGERPRQTRLTVGPEDPFVDVGDRPVMCGRQDARIRHEKESNHLVSDGKKRRGEKIGARNSGTERK